MAGTIELEPGTEWSAATWLYDLALTITADHLDSPALTQRLHEVVDSNFGWTNLADYAPLERNAILNSMRTHLVTAAQTRLPATVPNRDQALDLLQNLADLATHITANNPQ